MNQQKTVETLQVRYFKSHRQNVMMAALLREARVFIQCSRSATPESVWISEWLKQASMVLGEEQVPS